ncbi:MAG: DUF1501 domain-containing protein [Fuerstiella sp.]|nr:DUF1501 domain-containing protein [Fuerstiella sp.]MCP4858420.1 DUF1501 domain-containing protein [Fuerstiella sp.]
MNFAHQQVQDLTRRHFLNGCQVGLGSMALASMQQQNAAADQSTSGNRPYAARTHHEPKAKSVIYVHMAGSPSQLDLFDYKPLLVRNHEKPCPQEYLDGQRFAFIKGHPQLLGTPHRFRQHGEAGQWMSNLLPHLSGVVDELAIVRSMNTNQFNHAPAQLYIHTGMQRIGWPSMGSWITYGLGSENRDLPGFVVFVSGNKAPSAGKTVWGSGFLPTVYQGVQCRTQGDPVLYVSNPDGMNRAGRRRSLDAIRDLNQIQAKEFGDPETDTRIAQYELAYRMQVAVPEVMDISKETKQTLDLYGAAPGQPSFANNCLLARRLVEQGVRFVQLYDWGWDAHGTGPHDDIMHQLPKKCRETDQPLAALITDLKQRGMLDETLIVWGGEFGRTSMNEKRNGSNFLGRDHHPHAFTMWMAGGGIKPGVAHGSTDDLGYFAAENKMTVRDLQATILHLTGLDPYRLNQKFQGLEARLIGPADGPRVVKEILA